MYLFPLTKNHVPDKNSYSRWAINTIYLIYSMYTYIYITVNITSKFYMWGQSFFLRLIFMGVSFILNSSRVYWKFFSKKIYYETLIVILRTTYVNQKGDCMAKKHYSDATKGTGKIFLYSNYVVVRNQ